MLVIRGGCSFTDKARNVQVRSGPHATIRCAGTMCVLGSKHLELTATQVPAI